MRLTKNPNDMKEFAIAGEPHFVVLMLENVGNECHKIMTETNFFFYFVSLIIE